VWINCLTLSLGKSVSNETLIVEVMKKYAGAKISVLSRVTEAHIRHEPYTHLVISPALPPDLYEALDLVFPTLEDVLHAASLQPSAKKYPVAPNTRHKIQTPQALGLIPGAENLHPLWRHFSEYHTSPAFYDEMVSFLGKAMAQSKGQKCLPTTRGFKGYGIRNVPVKTKPSVVLDCQVSMNTPPVKEHTTVRGAHLDADEEIYAGLLYFRGANDRSKGGDLEVIKCINPKGRCVKLGQSERASYAKKGFAGVQFHPRDIKVASTVPYEANTLAFFVNGPTSYHAVTPRSVTPYPRRFVNIVAQFP